MLKSFWVQRYAQLNPVQAEEASQRMWAIVPAYSPCHRNAVFTWALTVVSLRTFHSEMVSCAHYFCALRCPLSLINHFISVSLFSAVSEVFFAHFSPSWPLPIELLSLYELFLFHVDFQRLPSQNSSFLHILPSLPPRRAYSWAHWAPCRRKCPCCPKSKASGLYVSLCRVLTWH